VSHPERIVPDETEPGVVALHLKRYAFASEWCTGRDVLDAACGVGYGSAYLAERGARVLGVDIDESTIEYARERYGSSGAEFATMDVTQLALPPASRDVVCSFETIEHVPDPGAAIRAAARVLRPDGVYIVSTPHAATTTWSPANPFHHVELDRGDFERLLGESFEDVTMLGQRRRLTRRHRIARRADVLGLRRRLPLARGATAVLGTPGTASVTLDDVVIDGRTDGATELIAVCRRPAAA
jgi:SAM-dependent methyltransferase